MNRLWILAGWLLMMVSLSSPTRICGLQRENEGCTDEDYAIFSAAINGSPVLQKLDGLVFINRTVTAGYPLGLSARTHVAGDVQALYDAAPQGAIDDFESRNKMRVGFDGTKIKVPFQTFSRSEEEAEKLFHRTEGWEAFHKKYQGATMLAAMSRPGINREDNRALLYMGLSCGSSCAGGTLILLSKDDGKRKIIQRATTWLS
jgi:hypothetical protein